MLDLQKQRTSLYGRDDVLTLLIHLGYLAYDETGGNVYIPNLEVADAFKTAIRKTEWKEVSKALAQSERLLDATINGECEAVADALELAHAFCA